MTHPGDGEFSPDGGLGPGGLGLSFSALQSKTEEEWREEQNSDVLSHFVNIPFVIGIINELIEVLTGVEDGDSGDVASWVNLLLGRDESLASRVSRIENKIALGAEFFDDFNRGDNDSVLGNGWTGGGDGQPLGIHDQAAQVKRDLLPDDGTQYRICPQVADGDDFTVSMVVHPAGVSANPETVLYARMNTEFTQGICVRMKSGSTRIARVTGRSGGTFSYTNIGSAGTKYYSNSATIEFKGSGTALQCVIDGVLVVDTTDATHTIGSGNRTVGFSAQCWTQIAAIPQYSGGLASFAMRSSVSLTAVQTALTTAQTADTNASTALSAASTASSVASGAAATANSKSKVTKGPSAPSSPATGDLWIDTTSGDGYALYKTWNDSSWVTTTDKVAADIYDQLQTGDQIDTFSSDGTWTKPAGAKRVVVHLIGGGAGGGRGGSGGNLGGGSGGAGGWQRAFPFDAADLGSTESVVIGAGGAGATSDNTLGQTGGTTSFGSHLSATGGTCGARGTNGALGGTGTTGSGVDSALLLCRGGRGGSGSAAGPEAGGAGPFSNGGASGSNGGTTSATAGGAGSNPGSSLLFGPGGGGGGGGASTSGPGDGRAGGNGGQGAGGGGGGSYSTFGTSGNGGNGGNGKCWVVTQFI